MNVFFCFRALTEKIVAVLPKMKCPHRIEPHQIQGLDFIHIYPVVQVLYHSLQRLPGGFQTSRILFVVTVLRLLIFSYKVKCNSGLLQFDLLKLLTQIKKGLMINDRDIVFVPCKQKFEAILQESSYVWLVNLC